MVFPVKKVGTEILNLFLANHLWFFTQKIFLEELGTLNKTLR